MKAMRAFRMVSAERLENFLQAMANENNFDDILVQLKIGGNTHQEGTG